MLSLFNNRPLGFDMKDGYIHCVDLNVSGNWGGCTAMLTIVMSLLSISSYNLVGVTFFRFLSIKSPLTFAARLTHRKAAAVVACVWVIMPVLSCAFFLRPEPTAGAPQPIKSFLYVFLDIFFTFAISVVYL